MKKLFLFIAVILLFSLVNAMEKNPFTKEDFKLRLDNALGQNRQETLLKITSDESGRPQQEQVESAQTKFERLDVLKEQAIIEYNVFYDAYYEADAKTVQEKTFKLKTIFDEMNSLMVTIVKFDGIYSNIYYWGIQLDYYIEKGIFESKDSNNNITNKTIKAVKEKTGFNNEITDINAAVNKDKPVASQGFDFVPVIAVILIVVVIWIIYIIFVKK